FQLIFPSLPKGTKSIDFIESDCETCFKIWDIDLTGKAKAYKPQLPADIINFKTDREAPLEALEFKLGKTKVNLHVTGWKEGYLPQPVLNINHIVNRESEEVQALSVGTADFEYACDLRSTSLCYVRIGQQSIPFYAAPGEEVDIYYDMTANSRRNSRYHAMPDIAYAGFKGKFANLNMLLLENSQAMRDYNVDIFSDESLLNMTADQFADHLLDLYNKNIEKMKQDDLPVAIAQFVTQNLKSTTVSYIFSMEQICESIYRRVNKVNYDTPIDYKGPKYDKELFLKLKVLDLGDPLWVYSTGFAYMASSLASAAATEERMREVLGAGTGLIQDLKIIAPEMARATSQVELTPEMKATFETTSNPSYYIDVYNFILEKTKRQYEEAMKAGGFEMLVTPDVASDKILEAIVAQYKGKVIFVDFWATWCGPCLNAMKTIKPIKPEMAEMGVVSIYISNASSPYAKWVTMLPEIGGLHYYLTAEQWDVVSDKYNIRGIPTYMIFDKSGKKTFETAGYPGNDKIKEELTKIN
ncbi:TlpA family protein disulfide reductase, partial [Parabacteroides sp. OttesenSCG-928-G06]|nr:TlpA family protein disulfide reductase [Parabacteroides sp. OttesenSCG-928-G06]